MTIEEIRKGAPEGVDHYCVIKGEVIYLKLINRDLYKHVGINKTTFFVDTKKFEIKPL